MATEPKSEGEEEQEPDWVAIQTDYVTQPVTLQDLVDKYHLKYGTVGSRAAREDWTGKRASFMRRLAKESQDKIRRKYVNEVLRDFERLEGAAIRLTQQVVDGKKVLFYTKDGEKVEFMAPLEANSLDAAANALINIGKAKAAMAGIAGEITRQEQTGEDGEALPWPEAVRRGIAKREAAQEAAQEAAKEAAKDDGSGTVGTGG